MHIAFVDSNSAALEALKSAKNEGHRVTFVQSSRPSFYVLNEHNRRLIGHADRVEANVETTDPKAVTAALARVHAEHPIDFAVSQFELSVEAVAQACLTLGLPGPSPRGVLTARRKDLTRAALRDAGLPTARFRRVPDVAGAVAAAAQLGYPVVIKPPSGLDSRLAFVARDAADARAGGQRAEQSLRDLPTAWHGQLARGLLVEEYLPGPLVSVELGRNGDRSYPFCISGRTRSREDEVIETGVHIPAELPADQAQACVGYAEQACRAIGLDRGVFHLEMIVTPRGPVLVEANPRIMGGILPTVYRHAAGHDIYRAFLQVISGGPVDGVPPVFSGCVAGRRLFARLPATMPARWDGQDWLADHQAALIRFDSPQSLGIEPGQPLPPGQVIARVILRGDDYAATARMARDILSRAEKDLGVELMTGEHDDEV